MADPIILENRLLGYHYTNATRQDKQVNIILVISETEGYMARVTFPRCSISYVFLFRNLSDGRVYFSGKSATSLAEAMDQPNTRIPLRLVVTIDPALRSIDFATEDDQDRVFDDLLLNPDCTATDALNNYEAAVRQAVISGDASTLYQIFGVDDGEPITTRSSNTQGFPNAIVLNPAPTPNTAPGTPADPATIALFVSQLSALPIEIDPVPTGGASPS